jgi:hypothetical protein
VQTTDDVQPLRVDRDAAPPPRAATTRPPQAQARATQTRTPPAQPAQPAQRDATPPSQAPAPPAPPSAPSLDTLAPFGTPHTAGAVVDAAASRDTASAATAARFAPPAAQLAQQIIRRVENGATRFDLRLEPPELGRVDVRLEMSRDHRVTAFIAADEATTLSQLMRSARDIEWALQSAGLELSQAGLSFDFADRRAAQSGDGDGMATAPAPVGAIDDASEAQAPVRALLLERWRGARVDLTA